MKYFYFVSYYLTYNTTITGFGSSEISSDKKITDGDDLRKIEELLNKDINKEVKTTNSKTTIINFQLLRKEKNK